MARRAKIEGLPQDVRRWLERALSESGFSGYEELEELLKEKGYAISKSAIGRYGLKIQRRFAAIKASTEAARMLTEGAADDQDARSEAVVALVQTEMFEAILAMQEGANEDGEPMDPADRVAVLSKAAKNIATLTRASVSLKRFQQEVKDRVKAAADSAVELARANGLSADAVESIRREILGIAQ